MQSDLLGLSRPRSLRRKVALTRSAYVGVQVGVGKTGVGVHPPTRVICICPQVLDVQPGDKGIEGGARVTLSIGLCLLCVDGWQRANDPKHSEVAFPTHTCGGACSGDVAQ